MKHKVWRDYWRDFDKEKPEDGQMCICLTDGCGLRMARYSEEDDAFFMVKYPYHQSNKRVSDVKKWVLNPYKMPDADNVDVPVECVYADLYNSYKRQGEAIRMLRKHIRNLYKVIGEGVTDELRDLIVSMKGHRLDGESMCRIEKEIGNGEEG